MLSKGWKGPSYWTTPLFCQGLAAIMWSGGLVGPKGGFEVQEVVLVVVEGEEEMTMELILLEVEVVD